MNITDVQTVKRKGKNHPRTSHEGPDREKRCNSTLPSASALDEVDGKRRPMSDLFTPPPGRRRKLIVTKVRSGRVRKISPPRGFDTLTVQPSVT